MILNHRVEAVKKAYEILNKLPSIGQTIGTLNARMRRCKRTDSKIYILCEKERDRLLNEQGDILLDIKITMSRLLTEQEQEILTSERV